jgi:hypothetical protein
LRSTRRSSTRSLALGAILSLALGAAVPASALRPGIPRITGFTDHFSLTIDASKSELVPRLAALAESCWAREARFFAFQPPGRIQIVFLDEQDYANGFAYSPQEWVIIHLHAAEFSLRGRTRWLPNVMAHEIGHVFTLRKMGEDSRFLGWSLFHAWSGRGPSYFEEELRWDYGRVPPWLAEGLAQFASGICGYDTLDNRRRMELRVAAAAGQLLTPAELKGFAWDGRRNEMIYAQGFALVTWLYAAYGPQALNRYMEAASLSGWRSAFPAAFGKSLADLYGEWRKALEAESHYEAAGDGAYVLPVPAGPYAVEASPAPLGDGRFLYLSSRDNDYGETDLFLGDAEGHAHKLFRRATSLSLDAASGMAYFTATRYDFTQAGVISDLYAYDAKTGDIGKLTSEGRMIRGCASGGKVYGLRNHMGRTSIVSIGGGAWTTVFTAPESFEITDLAPGPAPGTLTLGTASGFGNDLRELDLANGELTALAVSPQEEVDPHWSGDTLYYSADYSGNFDIYALTEGNVVRLTQADGGAFHPYPAHDGLWISAYGPAGFRLARARVPANPAAFTVRLPTPGWSLPGPLEYEADSYDHSRLSLLGYDIALGIERTSGFRQISIGSQGTDTILVASGSRALAIVGLYWENPNGVMDAQAHVGLSQPLGYRGVTHLDRTDLDFRIRALLPEITGGVSYVGRDFPDITDNGTAFISWRADLAGHLGAELRLAEHWMLSGQGLFGEDFLYDEFSKRRDSDPRLGGLGSLEYSDVQAGKDGVVKGLRAFVLGGKHPRIHPSVPEGNLDAGATVYASLARLLFLSGSLYHSEEFAESSRSWLYGGARAYLAVPLGLQLGTRGGAGMYLDRIYPMAEYREMARYAALPWNAGTAWDGGQGWDAAAEGGADMALGASEARGPGNGTGPQGYAPRIDGFGALIDQGISRQLGVGFGLRSLSFSGHPAWWTAMLRFDAAHFGREPAWAVSISL